MKMNRKDQRVNKAPRRKRSFCVEALEPIRVLSGVVPLDLGAGPDPDDEIGESRFLDVSSGTVITGQEVLDSDTDVDMFSFNAIQGQQFSFDTDFYGGPSTVTNDTIITIFDAAGNRISFNDDAPAPGEVSSFESYLTHTFTSSGTFYVGISGFSNFNYNPLTGTGDTAAIRYGYYTLQINAIEPVDTNDQMTEATNLGTLTIGTSRTTGSSSIAWPTDVNMYSFTVAAGQRVMFDLDRTGGSLLDSFIRIFNSSGSNIASNDDAAAPGDTVSNYESYLDYTFTTAGTYYLGVSGSNNFSYDPATGTGDANNLFPAPDRAPVGGYVVTLTSPTDPDDQISEARVVALSGTGATAITGQTISPFDDVDMYSFTVRAGEVFGFDIDHTSGSWNSHLRLFDGSGTQLAFNNDGAAPGESLGVESYLQYTFATAGTYYLGVSSSPNSSYNPITGTGPAGSSTGGYTLNLNVIDPVDTNDQISEATHLGTIGDGTIFSTGADQIAWVRDVSMYSFDVVAGQRVMFDFDRTGGSLIDGYMRIFNSSGTAVASNDNAVAPGETVHNFESYLDYTFATAGRYYLGVSSNNNTPYNALTGTGDSNTGVATGTVDQIGGFVVTLTAPPDPDDQISEATAITLSSTGVTTVTGQAIAPTYDVDMYSFTVTAGQRFGFDLDPTGTLDSILRLFDSAGNQIDINDDGIAPGETASFGSYLDHVFATGGTYYLGVSSYANTTYDAVTGTGGMGETIGNYSLVLTVLDPADNDDQLSEATNLGPIGDGGTVSTNAAHQIAWSKDVNMYRFDVVAGQRVTFDLDRTGGSLVDGFIRIFNSTGTVVASNDNAAAPGESAHNFESYLDYTFATGGTYYLGVSSSGNMAYNAVTGAGDVNTKATTATAEQVGGYVVTLNSPADTDDQISEARAITLSSAGVGTATGQSIGPAFDVDMYSFAVTAGQRFSFDLDQTGGLNSLIRLFDSGGAEIAINDDGLAPGETTGLDSYLEHIFATGGTYYLGVSSYGNAGYNAVDGTGDQAGSIGAYTLILNALDPVDTDDQLSEATNLGPIGDGDTVSTNAAHQIAWSKDVNMYRFDVVAGQRVTFDLDLTGGSLVDGFIRIFNSTGTVVASNDNAAAPGESAHNFESYLDYTFATGGTYYFGVSSSGNMAYNAVTGAGDVNTKATMATAEQVGGYVVTLISPADTDDQISEARAITLSSAGVGTVTGQSIGPAFDVDMYSFTVTAGQRFSFDLDRTGTTLDSMIRLFDSGGAEIGLNDDAPAPGEAGGLDSYLEHIFATGGTYYLGVSSSANSGYSALAGTGDSGGNSTGAYTLILNLLDPVDTNDQTSEANHLGLVTEGGTLTTAADQITWSRDVNMYSFDVVAGQRVMFDLDRTGGSLVDGFIRIFNSSGAVVASNDNAAAPGESAHNFESYLDYTFATGGKYYLGVSSSGNMAYNAVTGAGDVNTKAATATAEQVGGYVVTLSSPTDTDDQISEARTITLSATGAGSITGQAIGPANDVDMYAFTVTAGQRLGFDLDRTSTTLDSYIRLFDSGGNEIVFNDDAAAPGETSGLDSYLEHTFTTAGTYYLGVSSFANTGYSAVAGTGDVAGNVGNYSLFITAAAPLDTNDQISEATALGTVAAGGMVTSGAEALDFTTDVDMFSVDVTAGQRLSFDTDRPGGTLNTYLRIFDGNGVLLTFNDNAAAPGEVNTGAYESYLEYTFNTAGRYYIGISANTNANYNAVNGQGDVVGGTGAYVLEVRDTTPVDADDQISEATNIVLAGPTTTVTGNSITPGGDVDMFAVTVTAGATLGFDIDRPSGTLDSHIRLFDSTGNELRYSDNGAAPGEAGTVDSYLQYTFASAGTYYLGVSSAGNASYSAVAGTGDTYPSSSGLYTLVITTPQVDTDDQIGEANDLGALTPGGTLTSSTFTLDAGSDVDMFSFTAVGGQRIGIDIDQVASSLDSHVRIFFLTDSGLTQVASNDNAAAPGETLGRESYVDFTAGASGRYYIGVSSAANANYNAVSGIGDTVGLTTGGFNVTVSEIQVADTDDQISEAPLLTVGATPVIKTDTLANALDVDMVSFTVTAGQRLGFDVDSNGGTIDSVLRLFNSSGVELAINDEGWAPGEVTTTNESYLEYAFTSAGTYYVAVSGYGNSAYNAVTGSGDTYGEVGGYKLTINNINPTLDLVGTKLDAQATSGLGGVITVQAQIRNAGNVGSTGFDVQWYLSKNNTWSADDVLLDLQGGGDTFSHAALAGNTTGAAFTVNLELPGSVPGWTGENFFVIMRTDSGNAVTETNEANNSGQAGLGKDVDSIRVTPATVDLVGSKVDAPASTVFGSTISVQSQIKNLGTVASGAFDVQWYLSKDGIFSAGDDILLDIHGAPDTFQHASIAAGATGAAFTTTFDLPAGLPSGWVGQNFHIIMRTDSGSVVTEINEANNAGQAGQGLDRDTITIGTPTIDLVGEKVDAPTFVAWDQAITVQSNIRNAGNLASGAFEVEWYLSKDNKSSTDDIRLTLSNNDTSFQHASIAANATGGVFSTSLLLPGSLPTGWAGENFYIIMKTDSGSTVSEINENNNFGQAGQGKDLDAVRIAPTSVAVDLVGNQLDAPIAGALNGTIAVQAKIQNTGALASGAFQVEWYLSKDNVASSDDVRLDLVGGATSYSHAGLAAGATGAVFTTNLVVPGALPSGPNYYLIMKTDSDNDVAEVNENNNFGQLGQGKDVDTISITATGDWFGQNIKDGGLQSLARARFADGTLDRADVMAILREAGTDDGTVSANELTDLRLIMNNAARFNMDDSVRVLGGQVVNANAANAFYQGAALGNLAAGSTSTVLDKLVNKWFLGTDRPDAGGYDYQLAAGSLFDSGPSHLDIKQGALGDSYFLSALGGLAQRDPSSIVNAFTDNLDGTYTVRFFNKGVADYVTVDRYLPSTSTGGFVFASGGTSSLASASNELWVALYEKAYAQINAEAWIGQGGGNAYAEAKGIEGGWADDVLRQVRNQPATRMAISAVTESFLVSQFTTNHIILPVSNAGPIFTPDGYPGNQSWILVNADAPIGTNEFDIYNPWGNTHVYDIEWTKLRRNFGTIVFS